ncbi:MAG: type IV pili twitching motility protein PilT, partial [Clostridia bacterium]|nr:type IV pili twitching motility protein PilT [Clostridia bacterium]
GTDAALNLIRENKCFQMNTVMQSGGAYGMHTLNKDLCKLVQSGTITVESAMKYSNDKKDLEQYL